MRVVAGKFRGRIIPSPKEEGVKPTLDRVKENLFNILGYDLNDKTALDLFCGSGALGIEVLSRGGFSVFNDENKKVVARLSNFLKEMGTKDYKILNFDYLTALDKLKEESFDIIFLDPPYNSDFGERAIEKIFKLKMLKTNGVIVFEHEKHIRLKKFSSKIVDTRTYGIATVDFIKL